MAGNLSENVSELSAGLKLADVDFHNPRSSRKVYIAGQLKIQSENPNCHGLHSSLREAMHESKNAHGCGGSESRVPRSVFVPGASRRAGRRCAVQRTGYHGQGVRV